MSNYKTFDYFVNAYFHQDWREEAKNSEAILELFLTSEDIENIRSLKKDVENIIENEDINKFFTKNVRYFDPKYDLLENGIWQGVSNEAWLKFVDNKLDIFLS